MELRELLAERAIDKGDHQLADAFCRAMRLQRVSLRCTVFLEPTAR